ncbi:MAG: UDPGP type 1 family protein [Phycisphaerales bacterium]|nr:MAG: UDPGP type 1 family protein [Phycisphaerales bacterium]
MSQRFSALEENLKAHGQSHLLACYHELNELQQRALLDQLSQIDFAALEKLIEDYVRNRPAVCIPEDLSPAPYYRHDPKGPGGYDAADYRRVGEDLIRRGKVAAFTVAGGQGTRLGWSGPKGTYPATVVTGKPLFRWFAEQILATERKYGVTIPWYIMTSPMNHEATRAFFQDNNNFSLERKNIFMFPQGVLPSIETATGKLLLADRHRLAVNPDGHGGSIRALHECGAIEDMVGRGIEHISYFQIDNPLVKAVDPLFVGLHAAADDSSGEMSSKMLPKITPEEKLGVFCRSEGKTLVIEYSDLPEDLMYARDERGHLRFLSGSIAIHLLSVGFVQRLTADAHHFALPYHRADKKVPYYDTDQRRVVEPSELNSVKLETFVFDAIPLADSSIIYETSRVEEFGPIKNAEGVDSPATSHQLQSDRAGAWLETVGLEVPRDDEGRVNARIEISPLIALESGDLASAVDLPERIEPGSEIVIQPPRKQMFR